MNKRRRLPATPDALRPFYDVVIVGGGGRGLAIAYYLAANHGVRNVAVLDKRYIGGGSTARTTAIIRANYLTPAGVGFYGRSMRGRFAAAPVRAGPHRADQCCAPEGNRPP